MNEFGLYRCKCTKEHSLLVVFEDLALSVGSSVTAGKDILVLMRLRLLAVSMSISLNPIKNNVWICLAGILESASACSLVTLEKTQINL